MIIKLDIIPSCYTTTKEPRLSSQYIEVNRGYDVDDIFLKEYDIEIIGCEDLQNRIDRCNTPEQAEIVAYNQIFHWADQSTENKINLLKHVLNRGKKVGRQEKTEQVLDTFEKLMDIKLPR